MREKSTCRARRSWSCKRISSIALSPEVVLISILRARNLKAMLIAATCVFVTAFPSLALAEIFNIPKQELTKSLNTFANAARIEIFFSPRELEGKQGNAVVGNFSVEQALILLLENSGATFLKGPQGAVVIRSIEALTKDLDSDIDKEQAVNDNNGDESESAQQKYTIEEILVTSQRREQNLQKVPAAVTAFTGSQLREADISGLAQLSSYTPGLFISNFSLGQPNIRIRGVGSSDDGAGSDIPVSVYVDDVYVGRMSTINIDLFDLERIEVIRGPQGTLFGRNTTAGAINITSVKPSKNTRARIEASLGNFNRNTLRAFTTGSLLSDTVLGKVAVSSRRRDGYQDNIFNGKQQQDEDTLSARAQVLLQPDDNLEVLISAENSIDRLGGTGRIPTDPMHPSGQIFVANGGSPRNALNDDTGFTDRDIEGYSIKLDWITKLGALTSVTAFRESTFDYQEDSTGLNPDINNVNAISDITDRVALEVTDNVYETTRQFSQEFRLSSLQEQSNWHWLIGTYFLDQRVHRIETFDFASIGVVEVSDQDNRTESFALFGELSYEILDRLNLTLGLRQTYEKKDIRQKAQHADILFFETYDVSAGDEWSNLSPKFGLDYRLTDDVLIYFIGSRGFKSGGYQGQASLAMAAQTSFDEEIVTSYEVGFKSQWLDDRLRLNFAGYYIDYDDLQFASIERGEAVDSIVGVFVTANAASAEMSGFELELSAHPFPNLMVSGSYAYFDGEFKQFMDGSGIDRSGAKVDEAPREMLALSVQYKWYLKTGASIRWGLDYRYQGITYRSFERNRLDAIRAYHVVDARTSFLTSDGVWEFSLWSKNLTDELYQSHTYRVDAPYDLYAPPRTYGITLSWNYQ